MGLVMKLPGLQRQEVQSLGRRDIELPVSGAKAVRNELKRGDAENMQALEYTRQARKEDLRGAGADFDTMRQEIGSARSYYAAAMQKAESDMSIYGSVGGMFNSAARLSQENQARKAKRNGQEADLNYQEKVKAFNDKYAGRQYIDSKELTGKSATPSNMARGQVPSAEVLPQMLEEFLAEETKTSSAMIENEYFRGEWVRDAENKNREIISKANVLANTHLENQYIKGQLDEIQKKRDAKDFGTAKALVDGLFATDLQKKAMLDEINTEEEVTDYQDHISQSNKAALEGDLITLQQTDADYKADGGQLESADKLTARNQVRAELERIERTRIGKNENDVSATKLEITYL